MIFAGATVVLRANQVLCGLGADPDGHRIGGDHRQGLFRNAGTRDLAPVAIPYLSEIPLIGHAVFTQKHSGLSDLHHPAGYSAFHHVSGPGMD